MELRIMNPSAPWQNLPPENVFLAVDSSGRQHGMSYLIYQHLPHLYPDRPVNIFFSLQADDRARAMLLGTVIGRGRALRDNAPEEPARLYTCLEPDDHSGRVFYSHSGFDHIDSEDVYQLKLVQPMQLPAGFEIRAIPLATPMHQGAFVARLQANDMYQISASYLQVLLQSQHVCAVGLINNGNQLVGEALWSGISDSCELNAVYIAPQWRHQGCGRLLLTQCMMYLSQRGVYNFHARLSSRSTPQMRLAADLQGQTARTMALMPSLDM